MLNNKNWWKAAFVRALRTVAQTAVATIGTVYENKHLTTAYEPAE